MEKISALSTACKNCVFAVYDGDTQTGCEIGKIEKIKQHPVYQLVEAMDDQKNFYVLNYHLCLQQRIKGWAHDNKSMEEMKRLVHEEIKMNWGAILILRHEDSTNMERVQIKIDAILNQSHKPKWIGVINTDPDMDVYWIMEYLKDKDIVWNIKSQATDDINIRELIDITFDKFKTYKFLFYAIFESDKEISNDFYDNMYKYVIHDLHQYSVIKNDQDIHNMVVSKIAHIKYAGNSFNPLEDKIKKENNKLDLLLQYKDLL